MHNAAFRFAGSFVASQNANFVCLLHLKTRAMWFLQPGLLLARCEEVFLVINSFYSVQRFIDVGNSQALSAD